MISPKFHGANLIGWVGCVEERDDSTASDKFNLGRVRVRVVGYHSDQRTENDATGEGIPTEKLLWAYPIGSIYSASMNGIGQSPTGLVEGTWVFGLSMDGLAMQDLYILGTLGGVPQEKLPITAGFVDPKGVYPKKDFLEEEDTNRLARGRTAKKRHVMLDDKRDNQTKDIEIANPGGKREKWDEPNSAFEAKYPYNHVYESESGHIIEIDDTPEEGEGENAKGGPRKHEWHPTGTYTEIDRNGTKIQKIVGSDFEIILQNRNLYVAGELNITVGGNANLLVKGNCIAEVEKDVVLDSKKSILIKADENIVMIAKNIQVLGNASLSLVTDGPLTAIGANSASGDLAAGII